MQKFPAIFCILALILTAFCFAEGSDALVEAPVEGHGSSSRITSVADVPMVALNNGVQMPQFGLGTQIQSLENGDLGILNRTAALAAGYRHLDDAHGYLNERGVGQGIKDSGVPREETQYNIQVECWYPLGHRDQRLLNADTLEQIAAAHGKTVVQVILRWHIQEGFSVIPASTNPAHMQENIDIFDFSLTDEEMAQIRAMDQGDRGRYFTLNYTFMGGFFTNPVREWDGEF